jgi:hypothetical protein
MKQAFHTTISLVLTFLMLTSAMPEVCAAIERSGDSLHCAQSVSVVIPSSTLAAPVGGDKAEEKMRARIACTLPDDAIKVVPTKKFMGQWKKDLTAKERSSAARALERAYRVWVKHNKIENQVRITRDLKGRKVGHVNFNEQRKQIFFCVNTIDNAIYLLCLGSKNSQRESIFRPSREFLSNLADMAKQCSIPLVSSFVLAPEGYFTIAVETDAKGKMLGERLSGIVSGVNGVRDEDDSEETEFDVFDTTVAKYIRDSIKTCIDMFWDSESLRDDADMFADLVMSDVKSKVDEQFGPVADMKTVAAMVKTMAGIAHADQCIVDERAEREAAITSVVRSDFDHDVFYAIDDKKIRGNLIEKKCSLQAFEKRTRMGLAKLVEWYGGSDHEALKEFYAALACEVSNGSAMNHFLGSCDMRDYKKARDNFRALCDRIELRYVLEKLQIQKRVEACEADLRETVSCDPALENLMPDAYQTFKRDEKERLVLLLDVIPTMTCLSDCTQALENVRGGIQTLKALYSLEERIADIDVAIAGLPAENDRVERCDEARRMVDVVLTLFVEEPFDDVCSECEQLLDQIESMVQSENNAFAETVQSHVTAWGEVTLSVLAEHQRQYADYAGVIAESDQDDAEDILRARDLLVKRYDEFIDTLYPLAEICLETRDEQKVRQHLTCIRDIGHRLIEAQFDKKFTEDRRKQQESVRALYKAWSKEQQRFIGQFGVLGTVKYREQAAEHYDNRMREYIDEAYGMLDTMARTRSYYHVYQLQDEVCVQSLMQIMQGYKKVAFSKKSLKTLCMSDLVIMRKQDSMIKESILAASLKKTIHGFEIPEALGQSVGKALNVVAAMGAADSDHDQRLVQLRNERYFMIRVHELMNEWLHQAIEARSLEMFVGFDRFSDIVSPAIKDVPGIIQHARTFEEFKDLFSIINRALKLKLQRLYQPEAADIIERLMNKFLLEAEPLEDA